MAGTTFLTRVVLENYKSIAYCDVRLGPLNYLVGPNGAGKSNFIDALRFVADALKHSVGHAMRLRGGGELICHVPSREQGWFGIHLEMVTPGGAVGHYSLKVGLAPEGPPGGPWEVLDETFSLPGQPDDPASGHQARRTSKERGFFRDRLALALVADEPEYRDAYTALTQMLVYNINPRCIEDIVTLDPGQFLSPDGSGLASVLWGLSQPPDEGILDRINEYLRVISPTLERVRATRLSPADGNLASDVRKIALLFDQHFPGGAVHPFWPSQMCEGTRRCLGILTALFQAGISHGPRPSLVAIEAPEARVYPTVLALLRAAMTEASQHTQVLATTHSSDMLDNKEVNSESILVVTAAEGVTSIAPVKETERHVIRNRLSTAGELLRVGHLLPERKGNGSQVKHEKPIPVGGTP